MANGGGHESGIMSSLSLHGVVKDKSFPFCENPSFVKKEQEKSSDGRDLDAGLPLIKSKPVLADWPGGNRPELVKNLGHDMVCVATVYMLLNSQLSGFEMRVHWLCTPQ